jgi:hypothetical protein
VGKVNTETALLQRRFFFVPVGTKARVNFGEEVQQTRTSKQREDTQGIAPLTSDHPSTPHSVARNALHGYACHAS